MLHTLIFRLFDYLMFSGTLLFFGIGTGPSSQEKSLEAALASAGNFGIGEGEKDILASDNFWKAILSGDPGQIAKVMGPEMSAANKKGQESKKTASEFGNRGGGTNAGAQMTDDKTRSTIDQMISQLTGSAASNLSSSGHGLLNAGIGANQAAFSAAQTIHDQNSAKWNDIFKSAATVAAAPFTGGASLGMGTMRKPGGGGDGGNWWDNVPDYSNSGGGPQGGGFDF
jgi:hypothetical protein